MLQRRVQSTIEEQEFVFPFDVKKGVTAPPLNEPVANMMYSSVWYVLDFKFVDDDSDGDEEE